MTLAAGVSSACILSPGFPGEAVVNLMANDTRDSGPGSAQVDLPGSFSGWLLPPKTIPARGATSQDEPCPVGEAEPEPGVGIH